MRLRLSVTASAWGCIWWQLPPENLQNVNQHLNRTEVRRQRGTVTQAQDDDTSWTTHCSQAINCESPTRSFVAGLGPVTPDSCPLVLVEILGVRPYDTVRPSYSSVQTPTVRRTDRHPSGHGRVPPLSSSPCPVDLKRAKSPDQAAMTLVSVQLRTTISGKTVCKTLLSKYFHYGHDVG